jgi:hypothetical protein
MPLSSSNVDRRIPEALSTSRKRNLSSKASTFPMPAGIAALLALHAVRRYAALPYGGALMISDSVIDRTDKNRTALNDSRVAKTANLNKL